MDDIECDMGCGVLKRVRMDKIKRFKLTMFQENFEKISRIIKKEFEVFEIKKCEDFKKTIVQYMEGMLT